LPAITPTAEVILQRTRKQLARDLRIAAAQWSTREGSSREGSSRELTTASHSPLYSAEELRFRAQNYLAGFSKGLQHATDSGLVAVAADYEARVNFIRLTTNATPQIFLSEAASSLQSVTPQVEPSPTQLEGIQDIGAFSLLGRDAHAYRTTPPPALGSARLTIEMALLYQQAQLRDVAFSRFFTLQDATPNVPDMLSYDDDNRVIDTALRKLQVLASFNGALHMPGEAHLPDEDVCDSRPTVLVADNARAAFRGLAHGDDRGPYISQFLLAGSCSADDPDRADLGLIDIGRQLFDQRIRPNIRKDYLTTWTEWLDAQQGFTPRSNSTVSVPLRSGLTNRFIATPRDLACYVQHTQPLHTFTNAVYLLACHRDTFASVELGGLIALMAQASACAVRAARFQKYGVYRQLRPEALGARLEKYDHPDVSCDELSDMVTELVRAQIFDDSGCLSQRCNRLLPVAWATGAPMSPSYCSAYAAAAGACATVVKAFCHGDNVLDITGHSSTLAFITSVDGKKLVKTPMETPLAIDLELNKLASNLAMGRCWAGVSFYSDVWAGLRLGETVALDLLEEQRLLQTQRSAATIVRLDGEIHTL